MVRSGTARSSVLLVLGGLLVLTAFGCRQDALSQRTEGRVFPWAVEPVSAPLEATPGSVWRTELSLDVNLEAHVAEMGDFRGLVVAVFGEQRYEADGTFRASTSTRALSSLFTSTGIPVDTFDQWPSLRLLNGVNGSPFEGLAEIPLPKDGGASGGRHHFDVRVDVALPEDLAVGYWEPHVAVLARVEGVETPVFLGMYAEEFKRFWFPSLPLVRVGEPATPVVPWTAFPRARVGGLVGTLPEELGGRVGLVVRSAFPHELVLPPGRYDVGPGLPASYPAAAVPEVSGGSELYPRQVGPAWASGEVTCRIEGPDGAVDLGTRTVAQEAGATGDAVGLRFTEGPLWADFSRTGRYRVHLHGALLDSFGRRFVGGGTYVVDVALPLSFSTSCKPGTSFLVGDRYPPKVNVTPPVPAEVEVTLRYFPQSDATRRQDWVGKGRANRFGHFTPEGPAAPVFSEPGEYVSVVRARYRDEEGRLWRGVQGSGGVVAPVTPGEVTLHGNQTRRDGVDSSLLAAEAPRRYEDFFHHAAHILEQCTPGLPDTKDPPLPYDDEDSLLIESRGVIDVEIEARFSVATTNERIAALLRRASLVRERVLPRRHQPYGAWEVVRDGFERGFGMATWNWLPAPAGLQTELPVASASRGPLHPVNVPGVSVLDAYVYFGAVRPGLVGLAGVVQKDGYASMWASEPGQPFGGHGNAGLNGDMPGDIYRVQAGLVLKDRETGRVYYDAYSTAVAFLHGPRSSSSIVPAGARPLAVEGGQEYDIFLATDTHDCLEVGEHLGGGGMVFPNVAAEVTWTIDAPSGQQTVLRARANRLGIVRTPSVVPVDEPGLYRVRVSVAHGDLRGGIVGTREGDYWVGAVAAGGPEWLQTSLPGLSVIESAEETHIPLTWPAELRDVRLHMGAVMPGRVLEQRTVKPAGSTWRYRFSPLEMAIRYPNYDVFDWDERGAVEPSEMAVFQFFLEGTTPEGERVYGARRVALRGRYLMAL